MKILISLTFISLIIFSCNSDDPSSSEPEFYKLTISISGKGSYDVVPDNIKIIMKTRTDWGPILENDQN